MVSCSLLIANISWEEVLTPVHLLLGCVHNQNTRLTFHPAVESFSAVLDTDEAAHLVSSSPRSSVYSVTLPETST